MYSTTNFLHFLHLQRSKNPINVSIVLKTKNPFSIHISITYLHYLNVFFERLKAHIMLQRGSIVYENKTIT